MYLKQKCWTEPFHQEEKWKTGTSLHIPQRRFSLTCWMYFYIKTENSSFPVLAQSIRELCQSKFFLISISLIYSSQRKMHEPLGNKLFYQMSWNCCSGNQETYCFKTNVPLRYFNVYAACWIRSLPLFRSGRVGGNGGLPLVQTEISQQLLDGLPWNLVQAVMVPRRWILLTLVIPWLFLSATMMLRSWRGQAPFRKHDR